MHKPSFEEEEGTEENQSWFDRTRGSVILWIPSVMFFSVLDRRCCATCWGERSQMSLQLVFERSPPHLFLYMLFIQKKNNTNKDSASFGSPGSQIFIEARCMKCLSAYVSFYYYFHYMYVFLHSFYDGKLGIMGNFAR